MWTRFFRLLPHSVVALFVTACATAFAIIVAAEWHQHLLRFFCRSWTNFLVRVGSTGPGFLSPILVSVLSIVGTILCIGHLQGKEAMLKHWWENAAITALVTLVVLLVVYGPQFIWTMTKTVYEDHQRFVADNGQLRAEHNPNDDLKEEIKRQREELSRNRRDSSIYPLLAKLRCAFAQSGGCFIRITAPDDGVELAREVGGLAMTVSGCQVDVQSPQGDPVRLKTFMRGTSQHFIRVHAARDSKIASILAELPLDGLAASHDGFEPPDEWMDEGAWKGKANNDNAIWLQFGPDVQWR